MTEDQKIESPLTEAEEGQCGVQKGCKGNDCVGISGVYTSMKVSLILAVATYLFIRFFDSDLLLIDMSPAFLEFIRTLLVQILVISLGILGATTFLIHKCIRECDGNFFEIYQIRSILIAGATIGWIFYFAFGKEAFSLIKKEDTKIDNWFLMLPFLAGYSSDLVVGILNQMIRAIKETLGIKEKSLSDTRSQ